MLAFYDPTPIERQHIDETSIQKTAYPIFVPLLSIRLLRTSRYNGQSFWDRFAQGGVVVYVVIIEGE